MNLILSMENGGGRGRKNDKKITNWKIKGGPKGEILFCQMVTSPFMAMGWELSVLLQKLNKLQQKIWYTYGIT